MMSYRHAFHAGGFADVLKHATLTLALQSLHKKDNPFRYVDTHAGTGAYDLRAPQAEKTGEWRGGVGRLWGRADVPADLAPYVGAIRRVNGGSRAAEPHRYPGSPRVARALLRAQDKMSLVELDRKDHAALAREFEGDVQVSVHHADGWRSLRDHLPPPEHRGLVLLDPPYDMPGELTRVVEGLQAAHRRWSGGVYLAWYPYIDRATVERFHDDLRATGLRKILDVHLLIMPDEPGGRSPGAGLVVVNPPWQLDERLSAVVPWLWKVLSPEGLGRSRVAWVVPE